MNAVLWLHSRGGREGKKQAIVLYPLLSGFLTGLSLIVAIGAQNAFVLRQGLLGNHVFWLCLFCSLSDAILISIGVFGFSAIVAFSPNVTQFLVIGGAAFMFVYGALRFNAAWTGASEVAMTRTAGSLTNTLLLAAAFTWGNPHVYLDTVALIGAISTGFEGHARVAFALGAMVASFTFFFTLGYGARLVAPFLQSPSAWRVLDTLIGVTMWTIALLLILNL